MRALTLLFVATATWILSPAFVEACSRAGGPSTLRAFKAAGAVFVGTVERVEGGMPQPVIATFVVGRVYRGPRAAKLLVYGSGTSCDFPFTVGTTYVVFADNVDGRLSTHTFSGTEPVITAGDVLRYLDAVTSGEPYAVLYGDVFRTFLDSRGRPGLWPLFERLNVVARRSGQRRSAVTDPLGPYEMVLIPGTYTIWAERAGRRITTPVTVTLVAGQERRVQLVADASRVTRRMRSSSGNGDLRR